VDLLERSAVSEGQAVDEPIFADERQANIAKLVVARGRVRNTELTELFAVTETTIRKDLTVLQEQGVLKRTHGGAIAVKPPVERTLQERRVSEQEAKMMIARLCIAELSEGDAVFIDSGSTTQLIADVLARESVGPNLLHLTVLTNSIGVADVLADVPAFEQVLVGGRVRHVGGSVVGTLALENLERFTVNIAFIGASGLSETGLTVADLEEARLKAAVIERSLLVIVAVDHTKLGVTHFAKVCDWNDLDVVITDEAKAETRELCSAHGVRLIDAACQPDEPTQ
jgi:DeoR family fructose operon transcriptional repressor